MRTAIDKFYRLLSVVLLLLYSSLLISNLLISNETPTRLEPYCIYINSLNISDNICPKDHKFVNLITDNSLSYAASNPAIQHSKAYPLSNISTLLFSLIQNKIHQNSLSDNNKSIILLVYFLSGPILILVFLGIFVLYKQHRIESGNDKKAYIYLFLSLTILLELIRKIFGLGYPESSVGVGNLESLIDWVKAFIGPIFFRQGFIGFFGMEPRNFSLIFSILAILLTFFLQEQRFLYLFIFASLISVTQGLVGLLSFSLIIYVYKISIREVKLIRKVLIIYMILIFSTYSKINLFISLLMQFTALSYSLYDFQRQGKSLNLTFYKKRLYTSLWVIVITYISWIYLLSSVKRLIDFDRFVLLNLSNTRGETNIFTETYKLWGRAFIQEGPGRIGFMIAFTFFIIIGYSVFKPFGVKTDFSPNIMANSFIDKLVSRKIYFTTITLIILFTVLATFKGILFFY